MTKKRRELVLIASFGALVAAWTFISFLPALHCGFIEISDDYVNLKVNPHFRGLGWSQLRWMFTTAYLGPYQPLTWLSFALDFEFWGMRPFGYHFMNLLLHGLNACLFYFVSRRLLKSAMPGRAQNELDLCVAATISALLFAVHPLRVEPVAWITERRTVLSGFFYLISLLLFFRAVEFDSVRSIPWRRASVVAFGFSLLSKGIGVTFPVTLLILDLYPLRRLSGDPRKWRAPQNRAVFLEKLPYLVLASGFGVIEILGYSLQSRLLSLESRSLLQRVALGSYGFCFYLLKTFHPVRLSYSYGAPVALDPLSRLYWLYAVLAAACIATAWSLRKIWPAFTAACAHFIVAGAPMSGLLVFSVHTVADRYTYLSCLGWPLLAGGLCLRSKALRPVAIAATILLSNLTWRQSRVWRDSISLWRQAMEVKPLWVVPRNNFAWALSVEGRYGEAIAFLKQSEKIAPDYPGTLDIYGEILIKQKRWKEAIPLFEGLVKRHPNDLPPRQHLADALAGAGRWDEAVQHYAQILRVDPNFDEDSNDFGNVLMRMGLHQAAESRYRRAWTLDPKNAGLLLNLGNALMAQGKAEEAAEAYRQAVTLDPRGTQALNNLGAILLEQGRAQEAVELFRRAVELDSSYAEARQNLSLARNRLGEKN